MSWIKAIDDEATHKVRGGSNDGDFFVARQFIDGASFWTLDVDQFPNRVVAGPELTRRRFADNGDACLGLGLVGEEAAAANDRNS